MSSTYTVRVPDEMAERFERYLNQHEYPPKKSEVIRDALDEFLSEREQRHDQ
jgi:metal-responsive CopG/Arc/MetJ family transcriptional regulator